MNTDQEIFRKPRLLVLIPDFLVGNLDLTFAIHRLALMDRRDVFYLTIVEKPDSSLSVSRALATMKAVSGGDGVAIDSRLATQSDWLTALKAIYCAGDIIVCHQEQPLPEGLTDQSVTLPDFLGTYFNAPVRILSGYYPVQPSKLERWLPTLVYWSGFLLVLAGFLGLEVRIDQVVPDGAIRSVLLILAFCATLIVQYVWNSLTGRRL